MVPGSSPGGPTQSLAICEAFLFYIKFQVYILFSEAADKYYIGFTSEEILERIRKHNSNHQVFTGKWSDWKLVHLEFLESKEKALAREKEIKAWKSKIRIQKLVQSIPL